MDVRPEHLDDNSRSWVHTLRRIMDTTGVDDPHQVGTAQVKAETLTVDEQLEFSRVVDELADWFDRAESDR